MNIIQESLGLEEFKALSKKKGSKRSKGEENLQLAICNYLKLKYPHVIFTCDLSSGMKLPIWIAAKNKKMRSSRALPDLFIAKPRYFSGGTHNHGLFIELKKTGVKLHKKDGSPIDAHVGEQIVILSMLQNLGYKACFGIGFDNTIKIIDDYLK